MAELREILGYTFRDSSLLRLALTHPSLGHPNNQRLEFLGDAILEYLVSCQLFDAFPEAEEGELTRRRIARVCEEALSEVARNGHLGEHLLMGPGERQSGGAEKPSVLCDTFEAVLAAICLDGGLEAAREAVSRCLPPLDADSAIPASLSAKNALQEWTQREMNGLTPVYETLAVSGPPHSPLFEVRVLLDGRELSRSTGHSKQQAEKQAAAAALEQLMGR